MAAGGETPRSGVTGRWKWERMGRTSHGSPVEHMEVSMGGFHGHGDIPKCFFFGHGDIPILFFFLVFRL